MSLEDRIKYAHMKARHQNKLRPWYAKWWGVSVLIIIGLFLVIAAAAAFYIYKEVNRINKGESLEYTKEQYQAYTNLIDGPGGHSLGTSSPKITIVEFSDFACPYCKESAPEIRQLLEDYKDSVKLTVRDYPIHDTSIDLAIAARCAGEQGKYWDAYDSLFLNQDNLMSTTTITADLLSWADFLQLDTIKFGTCLSERRYLSLIKNDYNDGNSLQIQGTPTWFINNYPITGYYPADKFKELFDGILQQIK